MLTNGNVATPFLSGLFLYLMEVEEHYSSVLTLTEMGPALCN